ncbi:hypothetical protein GTA08_BOTSDO09605 [Botryosphaeria dothidea]|uniref:BTB domain-containing protein n=1 Tax=Botryosphaeria dothidea TaxID=55169 RepID=A0A8H4IM92_9PEZI|nr:hypothetical protein GTA08_BOTSDO09605 [Botryosphaeria dothidea]
MSNGNVRNLPRRQRQALLKGPTVTIELDAGEGNPRTLIAVPRAALKAFSTVAADLLSDPRDTNLLLPQGMAAPAALRYVVEWIPRACDSADFMPIKRKDDFKHNVRIYQAAQSLGITEALTTIGGWLNLRISSFEKQPWSWEDTLDMLVTLPKDAAIIDRLIEKVALARRRKLLSPDFCASLSAFLLKCPELAARFRVEDDPQLRQEKRQRNGDSPPASDDRSSSNGSENRAPDTRKRSRGGRKHRRSAENKRKSFDYSNNRILSDADVDFLMGRL